LQIIVNLNLHLRKEPLHLRKYRNFGIQMKTPVSKPGFFFISVIIKNVFDTPSRYYTGVPRLGVSGDGKTQQVEDGFERKGPIRVNDTK